MLMVLLVNMIYYVDNSYDRHLSFLAHPKNA